MDEYLDIRTLSLVSGVIALVLAASMLHVMATRKTYPGFGDWTLAAAAIAAGLLLIGLRDFVPDFATVIAANLLIVVGAVLVLTGLQVFAGGRRTIAFAAGMGIVMVASFLYFTYADPDVRMRIIVISIVLSVLYGRSAHLVLRRMHQVVPVADRLLIVALGGLSAWFGLRAVLTIASSEAIADFMSAPALHALTMVVNISGLIFLMLGLIIVNSQRLEADLSRARGEVRRLEGLLPICSSCKMIRAEDGSWRRFEAYIREHSEAEFSHGLCPECLRQYEEIGGLEPEATTKIHG